MKIVSVVGARPNFMKIAPFIHAINAHNTSSNSEKIEHILVHTGQHYDDRMSKAFFKELNIPDADINLEVGSGTHAEQVGNTMIEFEKVVCREKPDWVVVVGDVNATCACSITAKKENVKVAHIEAGLRSRDMTMPEEINRLVTDRLSDLLLTPDRMSSQNLISEGVPKNQIHFVGNIMIDTLESNREKASLLDSAQIIAKNLISENSQRSDINSRKKVQETQEKKQKGIISRRCTQMNADIFIEKEKDKKKQKAKGIISRLSEMRCAVVNELHRAGKETQRFALLTMHRPSNVDDRPVLEPIVDFLTDELVKELPLFWIIHPRTEKKLKSFGLWGKVLNSDNLFILGPLGYHELLRLNMSASIMLTDSGGLQEECCVLGTPCLTLRWNTERPVTLREHGGASVLVGNDVDKIRDAFRETLLQKRVPMQPDLWDGRTADRILQVMINAN